MIKIFEKILIMIHHFKNRKILKVYSERKKEVNRSLSFEKWLQMSDEERSKVIATWNPYNEEGYPILEVANSKFQEEYKNFPDIHIGGFVVA